LWNSTSTTFDAGTALRKSEKTLDPDASTPTEITFSGVDQDIPTGTKYLYVLVDLTSAAEGDVQPSLGTPSDLTLDRGALSNDQAEFPLALSSSSTALPVELAKFEGTVVRSGEGGASADPSVRLTWRTASETGNAGFEVQQRSEGDGTNEDSWRRIGYRESKATGGTTQETQTYQFVDEDVPYAADSVSYRLRQVDTDGSASFSEPITVGRSGPGELTLLGTTPNPARQLVSVRYGIPETMAREGAGDARLRLYDVLGRQVRSVKARSEAGRHSQILEVQSLTSGVYVLRLQAGNRSVTRKLTVVK
jgi:hypothetical protein